MCELALAPLLVVQIDPTEWRVEVERVAPKLRILLNADAKDWRAHLEEVTQHTKVREGGGGAGPLWGLCGAASG